MQYAGITENKLEQSMQPFLHNPETASTYMKWSSTLGLGLWDSLISSHRLSCAKSVQYHEAVLLEAPQKLSTSTETSIAPFNRSIHCLLRESEAESDSFRRCQMRPRTATRAASKRKKLVVVSLRAVTLGEDIDLRGQPAMAREASDVEHIRA